MAKPTGAQCNLGCAYCFFLKKQQLYQDRTFRMSDGAMERYVRQTTWSGQATIAWQGGQPTFERVVRAIRLLQEHQVEFNILCTVNAVNSQHPLEVYRFFRDDVGPRYLQFVPIVERDNASGNQEGRRRDRSHGMAGLLNDGRYADGTMARQQTEARSTNPA